MLSSGWVSCGGLELYVECAAQLGALGVEVDQRKEQREDDD